MIHESSTDVLLELQQVTKRYDGPDVLREVSLRVGRGEMLAIVGPSGSGKSTLLNLISAMDVPTSGRVVLDGQDLGQCNEATLAGVRNRTIGFVFQRHHLLPQCTVWENLLLPTLPAGKAEEATKQRLDAMLTRVGLGDKAGAFPGELSGGERQRVAVVRAMTNRPKLVLADEPTGSLDHAAAEEIAALLVELNRQQETTLMVVTHSLELAGKMGRVLELRDGMLQNLAVQST